MHPFLKSLIASSLIVALPGCATYDKLFGKHSTDAQPAASTADKPSRPAINQAAYSGYLVNYNDMQPVVNPSGDTSLRWVNPALKKGQYTAIVIDPVGFYPKPPQAAMVSKGIMLQVVQYLADQARQEIGHDLTIVSQPGPGVLRWDAAVTGVHVPNDSGSQAPIAKIFADRTAMATPNGGNAVVYLESRLIDSQSNKVMAKSVRRAVGKAADSKDGKMTLEMMKPSLDAWVQDARAFVRQDIVIPRPENQATPAAETGKSSATTSAKTTPAKTTPAKKSSKKAATKKSSKPAQSQ